ncbi:septal ring lytic transglycosylase RlpA family protein [Gemmatimonadota bacterium DH-20]|uniref:Probable endolytic peptidoglycan transglycosylase RlpA n=1 Tax=Gaopeijia maritima TaxID=3119007 RepID=A0ABU9E9H2_9BACT
MAGTGRRWRAASIASVAALASGCTLVGYPSGEGARAGDAPAPSRTADRAPAAPGTTPPPRSTPAPPGARSDAGFSYEVFGRRYRVLDSAWGYEETGVASWYGESFHGRPTASGETYDMYGYSAAHRTLPLHSWVEVVNLDNGRRIVLRVNDRGPFADTSRRILDLSYGAALELGVVGPGLAEVQVRALSPSELEQLASR